MLQVSDSTGVVVTNSTNSNTNYAALSAITVGSLQSTFGYAADLLPTQATGPNGDTSSTVYDQYARPSTATSKTGAVTRFYYLNSPASVYAYTNPTNNAVGRVAKTTLDGFGRTIKQESGTGTYNSGNGSIALSTVVSTVDTAYDSCGCSPMGKLKQTSRPYAPGGTVYWTVYAYDGIGRTKTVKAPDGASTTSYTYSGATVTVTDAASKAKTFTTDATGSLNQVSEPNPAGGAALLTNYSYDVFNRLRTVSMPRSNGTQTRTFTYTGALLTSATNPENGTVSNYYNADNTLNYKIDAKGQKMAFSYDSYKRVTQISKYPDGANEDLCQQVKYFYDSNPDNSNYPYNQYTAGRLVSVHYAGTNCQYVGSGLTGPWTIVTGNNYVEMYAYTQAGQVSNKRLRLVKQIGTSAAPYNPVTVSADMEAVYTYDQEGKMLTQSYPLGTTYSYTYDSMGRPIQMTDTQAGSNLVSSVTYGPAGELLSMSGSSVGETRTYNSMGQLVTLAGLNGVNLKYNYAAGSNNGQIASQQDLVSGETVSYQYDSLKRLSAATSTQGWNQNFGYDGFGNLTGKTGSGVAPVGNYPADPATNRLSGTMYDSNGNQLFANGNTLVYDVANRMVQSIGASLQGYNEYDASNKRLYQQKQHFDGSVWVTDATEYYFYGLNGKKIGTYWATVSGSGAGASLSWSAVSTHVFFRGKLISRSSGVTQEDVRGSVGSYYPYGEDRTATANDAIKFATYVRDSVTGLDYGVNRYHIPGLARFSAADPSRRSAHANSPQSWNPYSYAAGDPVSLFDPSGGDCAIVDGGSRDSAFTPCGPAPECDPDWEFCDPGPPPSHGGGGGGGGFAPSPEGTGPWISGQQRERNQVILATLYAVSVQDVLTSVPTYRYVAGLVVTGDCSQTNNVLTTGGTTRNVTYTAVDQYGVPVANATITERVDDSSGYPSSVLKANSSGTGTFQDQMGLGSFYTGTATVYQYFITSIPGTPWQGVPTPIVYAGTISQYAAITVSNLLVKGTHTYNVVYSNIPTPMSSLPPCN